MNRPGLRVLMIATSAILCLAGFLPPVSALAGSQAYSYPQTTLSVTPHQSPEEAKAVKAAEDTYRAEQHKKALADGDKIVQLANELKQDLSKSSTGTVSADVFRKADEIEKLARAVKKESST